VSFSGEYPQRVDGKGRMSIPAAIRRVLDAGDPDRPSGTPPRLRLGYGQFLKNNLRIYTVKGFEALEAEINARQDGSNAMRFLAIDYLARSEEIELDKDGRIVLPIRHREKMGIDEGEVQFMGLGAHCELWKSDTFAAKTGAAMESWIDAQPEGFDPISLIRNRPSPSAP
jgi:MraZ protein